MNTIKLSNGTAKPGDKVMDLSDPYAPQSGTLEHVSPPVITNFFGIVGLELEWAIIWDNGEEPTMIIDPDFVELVNT